MEIRAVGQCLPPPEKPIGRRRSPEQCRRVVNVFLVDRRAVRPTAGGRSCADGGLRGTSAYATGRLRRRSCAALLEQRSPFCNHRKVRSRRPRRWYGAKAGRPEGRRQRRQRHRRAATSDGAAKAVTTASATAASESENDSASELGGRAASSFTHPKRGRPARCS